MNVSILGAQEPYQLLDCRFGVNLVGGGALGEMEETRTDTPGVKKIYMIRSAERPHIPFA
jgi:hypothetical protein